MSNDYVTRDLVSSVVVPMSVTLHLDPNHEHTDEHLQQEADYLAEAISKDFKEVGVLIPSEEFSLIARKYLDEQNNKELND